VTDLDADAARARAEQLNQAMGAGAEHRWIAHHAGDGRWQVARVSARGMPGPVGENSPREGRGPERNDPPDPRSTLQRLIPPYGPS
jgi:hypothetical protein